MKTVRIEDDVHHRLTVLAGELTAQSGEMKTYADAIKKVLENSVTLPKELFNKIEGVVKGRNLGYTSYEDFVRDAVRRRVDEIEDLFVNISIPREQYILVNKIIKESDAPFRDVNDYVRSHIRDILEKYEEK